MKNSGVRPLSSPRRLAARSLPILLWSAPVYRISKVEHDPVYFGKGGRYRFDDPWGEYGILYASANAEGAFVETCIRDERPGNHRILFLAFLEQRRLVRISWPRPLRLVDLTGAGLSLLDGDGRLMTVGYTVSQKWARALWMHRDAPDGILYCSRFNLSLRSLALFDRAGSDVHWEDLGSLLAPRNHGLLGNLLDRYDFGLG
jgi:hypothetical protein